MTAQIAKILEGNWDQLKGNIKKHWGKLTDDDVMVIEGSYDTLIGKLKEAYGYTLNEAELEVDQFISEFYHHKRFHFDAELLKEISDLLQHYKASLVDMEESALTYVKKNPLKSVGIALVAGFIAGKLFKFRK